MARTRDRRSLQQTEITEITSPHNFAAWENHFGQNVIVHRKGATLAREGTKGIIPAIRSQADMQEASGAYKDIEQMIASEADLVRVKVRLLPVAVIKG